MGDDGRRGNLTVLDGSTFFVSDPSGDVEAVNADGFFHADMRHLSTWRLRVDGESPTMLSSEAVDYYSGRVVSAVWTEDTADATVAVTRERFLAGGVHEDVIVENLTKDPQRVELVLEFACDFGDILECHQKPEKRGRITRHAGEQEVMLRYKRDEYVRETALASARSARSSATARRSSSSLPDARPGRRASTLSLWSTGRSIRHGTAATRSGRRHRTCRSRSTSG